MLKDQPYAPGPMSYAKRVPIVFDAKGQVEFSQIKAELDIEWAYEWLDEDIDNGDGIVTEARANVLTASASEVYVIDRLTFQAGFFGEGSGAMDMPENFFCAIRHPRWLFPGLGGGNSSNHLLLTELTLSQSTPAALTVHAERAVTPPTGDPDYDSPSIDFHDNIAMEVNVLSATHKIRWKPQILISGGADFPTGTLMAFFYPELYASPNPADFAEFITDVRRTELMTPQEVEILIPQPPDEDQPFARRTFTSWLARFTYRLSAA